VIVPIGTFQYTIAPLKSSLPEGIEALSVARNRLFVGVSRGLEVTVLNS